MSDGKGLERPIHANTNVRTLDAKRLPDRAADGPATVPKARAHVEILRRIVAGESWAHAELYDALYPDVARALQKILHTTPDYEDLVQTSFERIVRTLRTSRAREIENLGAWASTIATRVALDALRSRIRERRIFSRESDLSHVVERVPGPKLERELDARRDLLWVQGVLASMNREQAETVLLHDVLGYDLWEVAKLTSVSPAAAQKRLSRGHLELRSRAERRLKGEPK